MRVDITGRHLDITPPLRQLIDRSLGRIERLLNDGALSATVILTKEKYRHRTELVVHARDRSGAVRSGRDSCRSAGAGAG